jgi:Cu+-exporting ATPase
MEGAVAIDPVCNMTVEPEKAAAKAEYQGTTYYFCSVGCQKAFVADPEKYVKSGSTSSQPSASPRPSH